MVTNDSTNVRLDTLERSVSEMSGRVGEVVKYMERLVIIEERNGFMVEQHRELKEMLKESISDLNKKNQTLDEKVGELSTNMVKMMAIFSAVTGLAAFAAPYVLKAVLGN